METNGQDSSLPTRTDDLLSPKVQYPEATGELVDPADRELLKQLRRMERMGILTQAAIKQAAENHLVSQEQAISVFDEAGRQLQRASHLTESQKQVLSAELLRLSNVLSTYNTVAAEAMFAELLRGGNSKERTYLDRLDDAAGAFLKHITFGLYQPYQRRR